MNAAPFLSRQWFRTLIVTLVVLIATSYGWSAQEKSLQMIDSDDIPILKPREPEGTVTHRSSSIRVIPPTSQADNEPQTPQTPPTTQTPQASLASLGSLVSYTTQATPQANQAPQPQSIQISQAPHQAEPIGVTTVPAEPGDTSSPNVEPDQSLRAIQLLQALSKEWEKPVPKTPSPFKEEPIENTPPPSTIPPAPEATPLPPVQPQEKPIEPVVPKTEPLVQPQERPIEPVAPKTEPLVQPQEKPLPEARQTPAPIESAPAPIVTPEQELKPLPSNDELNDDLPYHDYDESCAEGSNRPRRILQERLREGLFRGRLRRHQEPSQTEPGPTSPEPSCSSLSEPPCPPSCPPSCSTPMNGAVCPPGDPWGPGHWVGPGIWVPDQAAQASVSLYDGPDGGGPMYDDGVYGWGPPGRLFQPRFLAKRGITLGGWIDQGITYNEADPADRYNGPVTFNDRSADYQMNQFNVFLERKVDGSESGIDVGGRVDALFGTDARFTEAAGWESNWDMNERFYRLSVPQIYADFGWRDWTVRMGHFYAPVGYESVPAPSNFFYSHSYSKQYGEPFTYTGMMATRKISSQLKLNAGFHRGWDQFNGLYECDRLSVLGGANWISKNGRLKLDFSLTAGPQGPDNSTVMYSMVATYLPRGWLECVVQHDYGQSTGGNLYDVRFAEWYSLSQYVFVTLNERWKVGARVECFADKQGVRVHGLGQGNLATGPYPGDFWEVTLGLNWDPHRNVRIRPEARWDWYGETGTTVNRPFDGGNSSHQFLLGVDAIVQF